MKWEEYYWSVKHRDKDRYSLFSIAYLAQLWVLISEFTGMVSVAVSTYNKDMFRNGHSILLVAPIVRKLDWLLLHIGSPYV